MNRRQPIQVLQAHDGELVSLSRQGGCVDLDFRDFTLYTGRPDGRFDQTKYELHLVMEGVESLRRMIDEWRDEFVMELLIDDHPVDEYEWTSIRGASAKSMEIGFAMGSILVQGQLTIRDAEIRCAASSGIVVSGGSCWAQRKFTVP